ncbi:MAG: orotate phosphoribosyltransferase, partial [Hyphomicrobiales bacterium]|nr:orotate phosphoribosyltransferase [Hyphomicrobiales bacterium]
CEHAFVFFFYDIFPNAREDLNKLGIKLHALATWWDVLAVARSINYLETSKLDEVEKFLREPAKWSAAHGGISEFKAAG